jgi:hypothetical protein
MSSRGVCGSLLPRVQMRDYILDGPGESRGGVLICVSFVPTSKASRLSNSSLRNAMIPALVV